MRIFCGAAYSYDGTNVLSDHFAHFVSKFAILLISLIKWDVEIAFPHDENEIKSLQSFDVFFISAAGVRWCGWRVAGIVIDQFVILQRRLDGNAKNIYTSQLKLLDIYCDREMDLSLDSFGCKLNGSVRMVLHTAVEGQLFSKQIVNGSFC